MEGKTGGAAIRRSRELILFNLKKIIGAITLIMIITVIITSILTIPVALIFGAFEPGGHSSMLSGVLGGAINGFIQALAQPIQLIVVVLLYYDVRIRREGFDLEMMANELRRDTPLFDASLSPDSDASAGLAPESAPSSLENPESAPSPGDPSAGTESAEGAAPLETGSERAPGSEIKPETPA